MSNMTKEEKAKAYDEAVIRSKQLWDKGKISRENYDYIFPELIIRYLFKLCYIFHLYLSLPKFFDFSFTNRTSPFIV